MRISRRGRRRTGEDDGFVLLESIVAIALITVLMVALTSLFISAMQNTAHQRGTQSAIRIATDEIDQTRGLSYNGALSGRDQASVLAQFTAAPAAVKAWLNAAGDQAYDASASAGSGPTAQLPTVAVQQTQNNTTYAVSYYEEWCYRNAADKSTADCITKGSQVSGITYNQYMRVVIAASWTDATCPSGGCIYISSILLNGTAEPLFYFNDQPPPKPDFTACAPPPVVVGDVYSTEDPAHPALNMVGPGGVCTFTGGVPAMTWAGSGLPAGLAATTDGHVTGTVANGATTVTGAKLTVTDAFLIQAVSPTFTWTVYPRLVIAGAADRIGVVGTAVTSFSLTATGGLPGGYTWTTAGLPPGTKAIASASPGSTLTFSGTPTAPGSYPVSVTVTDASAWRSVTASFTWTVYPKLVGTGPGSQVSTLGSAITPLPIAVSGGSGTYTMTASSLPAGLSLTGSSLVGYTISGTPTTSGTKTVTLTVSDPTSGQTITISIPWTVNPPPTVSGPANPGSVIGASFSAQATANSGTPGYTYSLQNAPGWMSIDPGTGRIFGTSPTTTGSFSGIVVTATDSLGAVANSVPFTWRVTAPGSVAASDQQSTSGTTVTYSPFTCPSGGCTYSATPLPAGLSLNAGTGTISGTISSPSGSFVVQLQITDAWGNSATTSFTWTVNPVPALAIPKQSSQIGKSVLVDLSKFLSGGTGPFQFSTTSPSPLPSGLTLAANGTVSGTVGGTNKTYPGIVVTVKDASGKTATSTFDWVVSTNPLAITSIGNKSTARNTSVSFSVYGNASGGTTPYTFTVSNGTLPPGLALNSATGVISGTTDGTKKTYKNIKITVTDSVGAWATTATFQWSVT